MRIVKLLAIFILAFQMGSCVYLPCDPEDCCGCQGDPCGDEIVLPKDAVDLGLSVAWASSNIGAETPEAVGYYFSWGDPAVKTEYSEKEYAAKSHDIAAVKKGRNWRTPSKYEIEELLEYCDLEWTTQNEVEGLKVTGQNGNSIFIPASGCMEDSALVDEGTAMIWTSDYYTLKKEYASKFSADGKGNVGSVSMEKRFRGLPVRAVYETYRQY